jgi:hypothetical protein
LKIIAHANQVYNKPSGTADTKHTISNKLATVKIKAGVMSSVQFLFLFFSVGGKGMVSVKLVFFLYLLLVLVWRLCD